MKEIVFVYWKWRGEIESRAEVKKALKKEKRVEKKKLTRDKLEEDFCFSVRQFH